MGGAYRCHMLVAFGLLQACGGGGGAPSVPSVPSAPTYNITASINGLAGSGLILGNNGAAIPVTTNGTVVIASGVASGSAYNVSVQAQPTSSPRQGCRVVNGSGSVGSENVGVTVECRSLVGKFVYAVSTVAFEILGYRIDSGSGALTPIPGLPISPPAPALSSAANPAGRILAVHATPDGKFLITSFINTVPFGVTADYAAVLTSYRIDQETGGLLEVSTFRSALGTRVDVSTDMDLSGRHLVLATTQVSALGEPVAHPAFSLIQIDPVNGALSVAPGGADIPLPTYAPGQFGPATIPAVVGSPVIHPDGTGFYVPVGFGRASYAIASYKRGSVPTSQFVPDGWHSVEAAEPGSASPPSLLGGGLVISPDGRRLVVTSNRFTTDNGLPSGTVTGVSGSVISLVVDPVTGSVISRGLPDATCNDCWFVGATFSADSQSLLVINPTYYVGARMVEQQVGGVSPGFASINSFTFGGTGALNTVAGSPFLMGQVGVASHRIHPYLPKLYLGVAGNGLTGGVAVLQGAFSTGWQPDGPLMRASSSSSIRGIRIDSSGRFLYANDFGAGQIHSYAVNASTGQLTLIGTVSAPGARVSLIVGTQLMP